MKKILFFCVFLSQLGFSQARLVLNGAQIVLKNNAFLVVENPNANAITTNGGKIISEAENSNLKWKIGINTGTYMVPFGNATNYFPLTFTKTSGTGLGEYIFATYPTSNWQNSAALPTGITNFTDSLLANNSAKAIDRFWKIDQTGYSVNPTISNLIFTYVDEEHSVPSNSIIESTLVAQRFNTNSSQWGDFIPPSSINTVTNEVNVSSVSDSNMYKWWTLVSSLSPLKGISPKFTQIAPICSGGSFTLPTISLNGFVGTWSPAINNTATTTYTFTSGLSSAVMTVVVNPNVAITPFAAIAPICVGGSFALPTTSSNGFVGTWSPAINNLATTTYTFTPNSGQCATTSTLTVVVNPLIKPTFSAIAPICAEGSFNLPNTSTNGIIGTWFPAKDTTSTTKYVFTPTSIGCFDTTSKTVIVNPSPKVSISGDTAVCLGDSVTLTASGSDNYSWSKANVPLDQVSNIKLAVGLRKLISSYNGYCIKLRRSSDSVELDFGFDGYNLDVNAIKTWLNGATAYCVKLYDQSGNGGDFIQTVDSLQPVLVLDKLNGKAVLNFKTYQSVSNAINYPSPFTAIYGARYTGPEGVRRTILKGIVNNWLLGFWAGGHRKAYYDGWVSDQNIGNPASNTNYYVYSGASNGINSQLYEDGTLLFNTAGGGVSGPNGLGFNTGIFGSQSSEFDLTDVLMFDAVLDATDRNFVENSIKNYYTPTPFATTSSIKVSPTINTTYSVSGTNNSGCISSTSASTSLKVKPLLSATFDPIAPVCFGGSFVLPSVSKNGIVGSWTPAINNTLTTTYTFKASSGVCISHTSLTVVVIPLTKPTFNAIDPICKGTSFTLPTTSLNNIEGTWTPAKDSINTTNYVFTPSIGTCIDTASIRVKVDTLHKPIFAPIPAVCIGSSFSLPTTSINGIVGTWSPAIDNTATTTYTFTPTSALCTDNALLTVIVNTEGVSPTFTQINPICSGSNFTLPTTSLNNIPGTWAPAINNTATTTYTFTPTGGFCNPIPTTMTVEVNPLITATFDAVSPICSGDTLGLPSISNEGILGTWSPAINNMATTTYTFTPAGEYCSSINTTMTVVVNPIITPIFTAVPPICSGDTFGLPSISNEGIVGTWSPAINNTATTTYTFAPSIGQCASDTSTITTTVKITPIPTLGSEDIFVSTAECVLYNGTYVFDGYLNGKKHYRQETSFFNAGEIGFDGVKWRIYDSSLGDVSINYNITNSLSPPKTGWLPGLCNSTLNITGGVIENVFCQGAIVADLSAIGSNLKWYNVPTNGTQLTSTTLLVSGNYYVSQTVSGCESERLLVNVTINPSVTPTFTAIAPICTGGSFSLPTTSNNGIVGAWSPAKDSTLTTTYTFTPTTPSCATTTTMEVVVNENNDWIGAFGGLWTTPSNWSCGTLPNMSVDVVVPNGASIIISDGANVKAKNVTIRSTGSLTFNNSGTLQVSGNWQNAGTFTPGNGTIEFAGANQSINTSTKGIEKFHNLQINTGSNVTQVANSKLALLPSGTLTINGSLDLNNQMFILTSDSARAARLAELPTGSSLSNASNFIVQRYFTKHRRLRYLSSPVLNATMQQFKDSTLIVGPSARGFDAPYNNSTSIRHYNESSTLGINNAWLSATNISNTLVSGRGYYLFVIGKRTTVFPDSANVTLALKGVPHTGTMNIPVTYTSTGTLGWNLVGNPYPSQISWDAAGWTKTNIGNAIYMWDPLIGKSGNYFSYVNGISSDGRPNGDVIPSFQGFFVKANAANPVLRVQESAKVGSSHHANFRQAALSDIVRLKLSYGTSFDQTVLYFQEGATRGVDQSFDALKLTGGDLSIYTAVASSNYSINAFPATADTFSVSLEVVSNYKGIHTVSATEFNNSLNSEIYLLDYYTNKASSINTGFTYAFDPAVTTAKRFKISNYLPKSIITEISQYSENSNAILLYPNPTENGLTIQTLGASDALKSIEVYSIEGVLLLKKERLNVTTYQLNEMGEYAQGMYLVKVFSEKSQFQKMVTKL